VYQLIYSSSAVQPFSPAALGNLLVRARRHNSTAQVTGMLLHVDGAFLQVLEGVPEVINPLFARISADARHSRVLLLLGRDIADRNFGDWSMGFFDASGRSAALPGYRQSTGFADLLGDPAKVLRVITDFRDGRWRMLAA
jgi:hypothetical protein